MERCVAQVAHLFRLRHRVVLLTEPGVINPAARIHPNLELLQHLVPFIPVLNDSDVVATYDENVLIFGLGSPDVAEGIYGVEG